MWKYFASHDWCYLYYLSFNVIFVSLANNHVDSNVEKQEDLVYRLTFLSKHGPHDDVYTHWTPGSDFEAVQSKLTNCMGFSVDHCLLFCSSTFPFNVNHVAARKRNPLLISSWNNLQFQLLVSLCRGSISTILYSVLHSSANVGIFFTKLSVTFSMTVCTSVTNEQSLFIRMYVCRSQSTCSLIVLLSTLCVF